jgi:hypothetical protein
LCVVVGEGWKGDTEWRGTIRTTRRRWFAFGLLLLFVSFERNVYLATALGSHIHFVRGLPSLTQSRPHGTLWNHETRTRRHPGPEG